MNNNIKKLNKILCSIMLIITVLLSPMVFSGCKDEPSLSEEETISRVIENTSQAITQVDNKIMQEYEQATPLLASLTNSEPQYERHLYIDRGSNQQVYMPVKQMTISFGYYALSEYYLKYIPFFINKTLYIEQSYYNRQNIWTKCSITKSTMDINIWTEYTNGFDEYINITIYFNPYTLQPTKFIHRENRHWVDNQDTFGYIKVDFAEYNCIVETIRYSTNAEIDYKNASDDIIKNNVNRYVREEFNFANYKNRTTSTYLGNKNQITEQQMLKYAKNFNYAYTRVGKLVFDFNGAQNFKNGNQAMDFAFDKYLILEDLETGALTKVRN